MTLTKSDKAWLDQRFATKDDLIGLAKSSEIDDLKFTFIDNLAKWKSELFDKIDKAMGELVTVREENTVSTITTPLIPTVPAASRRNSRGKFVRHNQDWQTVEY